MQLLALAAFAGFAALMAAAAFEDFRRFTIPNRISIALCLLWPASLAAHPNLYGALEALGCGVAVFAVGALLFARGYMGGGDVKLLAVAVLWAGPALTPALLILTGLFGGALGLVLLSPLGAVRRLIGASDAVPALAGSSLPLPYGVAIAAAALVVILPPHFG